MEKLNAREFLIELGLGGLDPDDMTEVMGLVVEVLNWRVGQRIGDVMGPSWRNEFFEQTGGKQGPSAGRYLSEALPEHSQYVADELAHLKTEFIQQMMLRTSGMQDA